MGFTERISGKAHDHVPHRVGLLWGDAPGRCAPEEAVAEIAERMLPVFFRENFPKAVGLGIGKARQGYGRL